MDRYTHYQKALEKKREQREYNQLCCVSFFAEQKDQTIVNFASSDFLGLFAHPYIKKTTLKYALTWGSGTTPSRLVPAHLECHRNIEEKLAKLVGKESVLLFPSIYQMHHQILSTLTDKNSYIFIDRLSHYSLIQASVRSGAKVFRFEHHNYAQLKNLLEKTQEIDLPKWIISESLFSVNGEASDLNRLIELAESYKAFLYIDDSNSISMFGKNGMGLASHRKRIDVSVGNFGKTSGSFGAFIACNSIVREYLITFNPQLLATTILPPAVLGTISGALDLIPDMHVERKKVLNHSAYLRKALQNEHWNVGHGHAHIIPLIFMDESQCLKLFRTLSQKNILTTLFRPPIIPQGPSHLRVIVNALHTQKELSLLLQTLKNLKKAPSLSII